MKEQVSINWLGNMAFEADVDGHKIVIDAKPEAGGENKGARPKPFLLMALAGCTAMDVVSILKKMRVEFSDFQVTVEGDLTAEHPKFYQTMKVIYELKGKDLSYDKIEKAVKLSEERYCGVSALFKKAIPVTFEIKIVEA